LWYRFPLTSLKQNLFHILANIDKSYFIEFACRNVKRLLGDHLSQIHDMSSQSGHIPLIDVNPRWDRRLKNELTAEDKRCRLVGHKAAEAIRYNERSTVERVNARLKDELGGSVVRVLGHSKVMCHLMFGIPALTANQMMMLVT
jgi:hypothetical protein